MRGGENRICRSRRERPPTPQPRLLLGLKSSREPEAAGIPAPGLPAGEEREPLQPSSQHRSPRHCCGVPLPACPPPGDGTRSLPGLLATRHHLSPIQGEPQGPRRPASQPPASLPHAVLAAGGACPTTPPSCPCSAPRLSSLGTPGSLCALQLVVWRQQHSCDSHPLF